MKEVITIQGEATQTGLKLPDNLSYEEWEAIGGQLQQAERSLMWWIGDWLNYGERKYGEMYAQAVETTGKSYDALRNAKWVAGKFELSRRRDSLSWSVHSELAGLSKREADQGLDWCEETNASQRDARKYVLGLKHTERLQKIEQISAGNKPLNADRKYPVIYADPPWRYENPPMGGGNRSIENHYPTMTLEEICALPVSDIAHDDSVLFMWATAPKLAECIEVIVAWGFTYRTCIIWVKDKIGMGYHARNKHEILLIAKRGEVPPPTESARPASVIEAPRTEHSTKPEIFHELIEAMYPGVAKIELFCRSPREGWAAWGNQAEAA